MFNTGAPLADALRGYAAKGRASFHTPGHKGRAGLLGEISPLALDLTELPETGSLYDGGDVIEQAEKLAAEAFGAAETLFSAGGCTLCIQAMLLLGGGPGGRVLFLRNAHRSAVHAAALLGMEPAWLWPGEDGRPEAGGIAESLKQDKNIRAVYITSPDYYGRLADVPRIAAVCRAAGVPLLVDNAHGSHLGAFGRHPLAQGAAMTADSAHKTLPVLTGGAMLHIGRKADGVPWAGRAEAKAAMALFGSTSPGFPVLGSLDLARDWWVRAGREAYRLTAEETAGLRKTAWEEEIDVLGGPLQDPARLTLDTRSIGIEGGEAAEFFRAQGCEPEYADGRYVVFILTPFNTPAELERLRGAIRGLPAARRRGRFLGRGVPGKGAKAAPYAWDGSPPEVACSPREALLAPCEAVPAPEAAGRIAARAACPCPPGVAAVVPGERITAELAVCLKEAGFDRLVVLK